MAKINFDNMPVEPTITIVNPDGTDLITTNNPIAILFARLEIKHLKLSGFKVRTASGIVIEIRTDGRLEFWPDGEIPGDIAAELMMGLL